jgi:hypothetical protein
MALGGVALALQDIGRVLQNGTRPFGCATPGELLAFIAHSWVTTAGTFELPPFTWRTLSSSWAA